MMVMTFYHIIILDICLFRIVFRENVDPDGNIKNGSIEVGRCCR